MRPQTPIFFFRILIPLALLSLVLLPLHVEADPPSEVTNPNASRTVTWSFDTPLNLTAEGVLFDGGKASLAWATANVTWDRTPDFIANGSLDPTLTTNETGIVLRSDPANHVANGNFTAWSPWTYVNGTLGGPSGNVKAEWEASDEVGVIRYLSSSTEISWDSMDAFGEWKADSSPGSLVTRTNDTTDQKEGAGTIGLNFTLSSSPGSWVALYNYSTVTVPVDWSAYDRLVLWIKAPSVDTTLTFNLTARIQGVKYSTSPQPLAPGWQEVFADLDELGDAAARQSLHEITLRINGQNVPTTETIYFDDVRLAATKSFVDSASILQDIRKTNATTAATGSALLAFDWNLVNVSGVQDASATVNLTGPSGSFEQVLDAASLGMWQHVERDVSATTSLNGTYTLRFRLQVFVNDTKASHAELRVDNVSLFFPNRRNGTFVSNAIALGPRSEFLRISWAALRPTSTWVQVAVRSGNTSTPEDGTWSPWDFRSSPGTYPLSLPGGAYFQVQASLNTTDARVSPVLTFVEVETRHHLAEGWIESDAFTARGDFLRWTSFNASVDLPPNTSASFSYWNGSGWTVLEPPASLAGFPNRTLRWRADLSTTDGLTTPALLRVQAVYEFLGPVDHVDISPSGPVDVTVGSWITFRATAYDAGSHVVALLPSQFDWSTDDPTGRMLNNGSYQAGSPGTWNVTVTISGTGISDSVTVRVVETSSQPGGNGPPPTAEFPYLPYLLVALALASAGYLAYEVAVRRMFAIEDLFVIARDGRLMMHNTRRMRADRDEDILSGMLTAILSFVRDADREENGDLRRYDIGGKTTLLERGEHVYLAAVYSGRAPWWAAKDLRRFVRDLEARMGEAFQDWDGSPEDLQGLKEYTTRFVSRIRYRRRAVFRPRAS